MRKFIILAISLTALAIPAAPIATVASTPTASAPSARATSRLLGLEQRRVRQAGRRLAQVHRYRLREWWPLTTR